MVRLALLILASCTTTQSAIVVRDVRVTDDRLVIVACDASITISTDLDGDQSERASSGACTHDALPLPSDSPFVAAAPSGCEPAAERWLTAVSGPAPWPAQARATLWQTFPRRCRAYIEARSR